MLYVGFITAVVSGTTQSLSFIEELPLYRAFKLGVLTLNPQRKSYGIKLPLMSKASPSPTLKLLQLKPHIKGHSLLF